MRRGYLGKSRIQVRICQLTGIAGERRHPATAFDRALRDIAFGRVDLIGDVTIRSSSQCCTMPSIGCAARIGT